MPPKSLPIAAIRIDGQTQARTNIDPDYIRELIEAIDAGDTVPPLIVFWDGEDYWLADGFHRWHAYKSVDIGDPPVEVKHGTVEDAQWFALSCNKSHGKRRTNEDLAYVVKRALTHPNSKNMSNEVVARHCGVTKMTIGRYRKKMSANCNNVTVDKRTGADGRRRSLKRKPPSTGAPDPARSEAPDTPAEVIDALGQVITDPLIVAAFTGTYDLNAIISEIARIRKRVKAICEQPCGHFILRDQAEVDLKNCQRNLEAARPYALAPADVAKQKRFKCGWMTKADFDRLPKEK